MSKAVSALQGALHEGPVRVAEAGLRGMITLRGDLASPALHSVTTGLTGQAFPARGEAKTAGESGLAWMSPDELLILLPYDGVGEALSRIAEELAGEHHLAVNVSDARALFSLEGAGVREVLAKLTPADMHPRAFGPGDFRRTRLAQVPAAFWMVEEERVDLICFRSVAAYVFDLLVNAADSPAAGHLSQS